MAAALSIDDPLNHDIPVVDSRYLSILWDRRPDAVRDDEVLDVIAMKTQPIPFEFEVHVARGGDGLPMPLLGIREDADEGDTLCTVWRS